MIKYLAKNKLSQIISIFCMSVFIVLVHYLFRFFSDAYIYEIRKILLIIMITFGSSGGLFLLYNNPDNKSIKLFSIYLLTLAILSLGNLWYIYQKGNIETATLISPKVILLSSCFTFFTSLYPIEILRPGWLNYKRIFLLFLPIPIITVITIFLTSYIGPIRKIDSIDFLHHDNLTYVLICIFIYIYPIWTCSMLWKLKREYQNWCLNNFVVTDEIDIKWLEYYLICFLGIVASYVYMMTVYSPKSDIIHNLLIIIFCVYFYNKAYLHKNPYPQNYVFDKMEINEVCNIDIIDTNNESFKEYKQILLDWFDAERPYLRKEFRLINLNEKIPLNRSYLSRLINEEFDSNFNNLITEYRLQESCRLMSDNPSMSIKDISNACGFSSPSVFSRSFVSHYNITPLKYRNKSKLKNK